MTKSEVEIKDSISWPKEPQKTLQVECKVSGQDLIDQFPDLIQFGAGALSRAALRIAAPQNPEQDALYFVTQKKWLEKIAASGSGIVILQKGSTPEALTTWPHLNPENALSASFLILESPNVSLAWARIARKFFSPYPQFQVPPEGRIHPTAVIAPTAKLEPGVQIGPYACIGHGAILKNQVIVGSHAVVEPFAEIGENSILHSHSFVGHHCLVGRHCEILPHSTVGKEGFGYAHTREGTHERIPHLGRVVVGDFVDIGANVQIDKGTLGDTKIGEGTKIDNHCHIAHNVSIGKHCLITAGFLVAGSSEIGDHCVFGGRSTVNGHIKISSRSQFAGLSVAQNNVSEAGQYGGYPLVPLRESLRILASLPLLPRLRRQLSQLLSKLSEEENLESASHTENASKL